MCAAPTEEPSRSGATDDQLSASALLHEQATLIKDLAAPFRDALDALGTVPFAAHGAPRSRELLDALRPLLADLHSALQCAFPVAHRAQRGPTAVLVRRVQQLMKESGGPVLSSQAAASARDVLKCAVPGSRLHALAAEVLRVCTVASLLKGESQVVGIAEKTRILRDVLIAAVASPEKPRRVDLRVLVQRAIEQETAYADSLRIDLLKRNWSEQPLFVEVRQSDVQRALFNLLSNAIKYSYSLPDNLRAWVDIDVERSGGYACARFENWGVPVVADDLQDGRLFTPRYRGRHALKLGRAGTGIGLWDARETARRHRGDVVLHSKPLYKGEILDDEPRPSPHLTTVTLSSPTLAR